MTNMFEDIVDFIDDLVTCDDVPVDENEEEVTPEEIIPVQEVSPVLSLQDKLDQAKLLVLPYIKKHEAFIPHPYLCPADKLTIGYGTLVRRGMTFGVTRSEEMISYCDSVKGKTTRKEVNIKLRIKFGNTMSEKQAEEFVIRHMKRDLDLIINGGVCGSKADIEKMLNKMNKNQIGAILSFVYNIGVGDGKCDGVNDGFSCSTLLKKMKKNPNDKTIEAEFKKWNKGGGQVLPGLVTRRQEEADMYFGRS